MFGSEYVWILIGKPETSWWLSPSEPYYFYSAYASPNANGNINQRHRGRRESEPSVRSEESGNYSYKTTSHQEQALPFLQSDNNENQPNQILNCSPKELEQVVEYALVIDRHNFLISNMTSISGMVI